MVGSPTMSRPREAPSRKKVPTNLSNSSEGKPALGHVMRAVVMCAGALITSLVFSSSLHASTSAQTTVAPLLTSEKIAPWLVQQLSMGSKQDVFVVMNAPSDLRAA